MTKKLLYALFFLVLPLEVFSSVTIKGYVMDKKNEKLVGVNVFLKNTYDGATSDENGYFEFETTETVEDTLTASLIGYTTFIQKINLKENQSLTIILKEKINELNAVTITAGSFEASDEKKSVILRPLDIVTTAGANGDIDGALKTLPGAQQVGEQEGLFVRGGEASETKTYIDGMQVASPYFSSVPNIPQRGRFSPFLFKGTSFSTGGYSALYGQGMSSALILESQDMPTQSFTSLGVTIMGGALGILKTDKKAKQSVGLNLSYFNLGPYMQLVKQNVTWHKAPQNIGASFFYRYKPTAKGLLKVYIDYGYGQLSVEFNDIEDSLGINKNRFSSYNNNIFSSVTYKDYLKNGWGIMAGISHSFAIANNSFQQTELDNSNKLTQGKLVFTKSLNNFSNIRFGTEIQNSTLKNQFGTLYLQYQNLFTSIFAESDLYFTKNLLARIGLRSERSNYSDQINIAPRLSIAYKTGKDSQVSVAYGDFYQEPNVQYSLWRPDLKFEKATHYIINFQKLTEGRTFRVETYWKQYKNLVKITPDTSNNGFGYARGLDLFYRDKKLIKYGDLWVSYSFCDSKRLYKNYLVEATPTFVADHTLSIVYKQFFPKKSFGFGGTLTLNSGRPYYNPQNPVYLGDKTPFYKNFSLNFNYLTQIFKNFTVVVLSVDNVFGLKNVYSYQYSSDGRRRQAIGASAPRSIFIGMFMTFGVDRGNDDNNEMP